MHTSQFFIRWPYINAHAEEIARIIFFHRKTRMSRSANFLVENTDLKLKLKLYYEM